MDSYFDSLDEIQQTNNDRNDIKSYLKCCDNIDNYMPCESHTLCRICNQPITVLNSNPEKCYDSASQRTGMATSVLLPDSNSGSVISSQYISNNSMRTISRLNMYQGMPYKTRSLLIVFNSISEKCNRHNISKKIINEAQSLYKLISQYKISRGSNRLGIISATIFLSCKNCGNPRSTNEIAQICEISKKVVTKGIKILQDIIHTNKIPQSRIISTRVTAIDLIDRICNDISLLNYEDINNIKLLCDHFTENYSSELSSCTPPSLSASIIYYYIITNNISIDKNLISEKSNVSVVTIQKITNILVSTLSS